MWPQALQMTRDECRGILRRLELESYSQVISVFRAQGGLSDAKAKLLEELRNIFHISNERHRAEARRVANDEQLSTIAEAISGPNTWQEWSREGRRPYPLLPRVAPQTALALIANNVSEETAQENWKLPYPADTGEAVKEEQLEMENQKSKEVVERCNFVVTSDPFKIPEIPQNPKKNLKRNNEQQSSGANKKRSVGDNVTPQQGHIQAARKNYPHITANSPQTNSSASSTNVVGDRKQKLNASDPYLEKQRFFHRQHQISKQKMAKKAAAAGNMPSGGNAPSKRQTTPAKSGRRASQKQLAMKQLQMDMQQQQQQQQVPMQIDLTCSGVMAPPTGGGSTAAATQAMLTQQQLDMQFVTYATHHQPPQQIFKEKDIEGGTHAQLSALPSGAASTAAIAVPISSSNQYPASLITPLSSPQIAASKRDISKNLNKLQMQQNQQLSSLVQNVSSALPPTASMPSHDLHSSFGNILSSSSASVSALTSNDKNKSSEKTLISTTPVQKYIVEERQPGMAFNMPTCSNPSTLVNLQSPIGATQTHILQVTNTGQQPQIMSFPQISAAATKLRAVNTTLIAPGAKMASARKIASTTSTSIGSSGSSSINAGALHELANVASTQSQVLHVVEPGGGNNNNPLTGTHGTPLHTPPAVIQLHNTAAGATAASSDISTGTSHGKVLTTKILPLVLAGSGNQNTANTSLINNSTLVMSSSPSSSVSITSTTSTAGAGGSAIIKSLSSNVLLNTSSANLTPVTVTSTNNPIISTLGAGTVFRKPPNIIKTSVAATSSTKSISSSAPHIISNVKLTPVSVGQTSSGTHLATASTFKNVLPSTSGMVRTSVKICQSSNGKVFIQSAGVVDGSKMKLNTTPMPHKILSNTPTANSSAITSSGQRIAIQKVQIIPAPINPPTGGLPLQTTGNHINTKSGKGNMIFVPTSTANVRPVTLSKMGNNLLLKSSANQQLTPTSPTTTMAVAAAGDNSMAKSNIVVLSPTPSTLVKDHVSKLENAQLINEDTPLDILNMPIVMEPGVEVTSSSPAAETVTVLQSNIIDATSVSSPSALAPPIILDQTQLHQPSKTVVLNVDWEMKLDIEQQNQYNNKNLKQHKRILSPSSSTTTTSVSSSQQSTGGLLTKQRRLNNEFITASNSANNVIVLDDSFDDVIVEEHEDDASSITSMEKQHVRQQTEQQIDNDIPKILDMQIYQQHDGHDNRIAQIKTNNNDDDVEIDVNDDDDDNDNDNDRESKTLQSKETLQTEESTRVDIDPAQQELQHKDQQQQHQHLQFSHVESEIDAGFDETIVTEIDENTALEYIEEDGASTNLSTSTTNTTITSPMSKKTNKVQQKLATKTLPTAAITTTTTKTIISNEENPKSGNDQLVSSFSAENSRSAAAASRIDNLETEETATITLDATQETIIANNNSATQQVEP